MANEIISGNQTTAFIAQADDQVFLTQTGSITVTSGPALTNNGTGANIGLQIDGNATTLDASDAISLEDATGNLRVTVGATGSVTSMQG